VTLDHRPPQAVGILVQRPERSALGADEAVGEDVLVVAANLMLRLSLSSERDREREEANRDFFSRTGRWPDDRSG
jgi:hypothetical protein